MIFRNDPPSAATLPWAGWDNSLAIAVPLTKSSTFYWGNSDLELPDEGEAKSDLLSLDRLGTAGNFLCGATGFKFLLVPVSMDAPLTIRDIASGFSIELASTADGFTQETNGLYHASLEIDGYSYRVYRSKYQIGSEMTLQVAIS